MDSYLIGGGALLEAGERSTITRATLHAQLAGEGETPRAALIDFESGSPGELRRLLVLAAGFTAERFETTVTVRLQSAGVCGIEDVAALLAGQVETDEVHLYARWAPPAEMSRTLAARGIHLIAHPLEAITRAALIAEQRFSAWSGPPRAA
jgi:hypothetical protein